MNQTTPSQLIYLSSTLMLSFHLYLDIPVLRYMKYFKCLIGVLLLSRLSKERFSLPAILLLLFDLVFFKEKRTKKQAVFIRHLGLLQETDVRWHNNNNRI